MFHWKSFLSGRYWLVIAVTVLPFGVFAQDAEDDDEVIEEINTRHTNQRYLKKVELSEKIRATADLSAAVDGADVSRCSR